MFTNQTFAIVIDDALLDTFTMPYNSPDYFSEPKFYIDMTSRAEGIDLVDRKLSKDVYDSTYWQSKQINAVVMPWIPYFSNCEGYDSKLILYDIFEYNANCSLPTYDDIQIVNPIPSSGLNPVSDSCKLQIQCRYDEPLNSSTSVSTRWYEIDSEHVLFYITRNPIDAQKLNEQDDSGLVNQTIFIQDLNSGTDNLLPATFYPDLTMLGLGMIPSVVTVNFLYYQSSKDVKQMSQVSIYLSNYTTYTTEMDQKYTLIINYEALSYFSLINTFQFSLPIYILLFSSVSLILVLSLISFWLLNLNFSKIRKAPYLRFKHMAKVIFFPPAKGTILASVPALIIAGLLKFWQGKEVFIELNTNWSFLGDSLSTEEKIANQSGRLGLFFVIIGIIFMLYGSYNIISLPSEEEEENIISDRQQDKRRQCEIEAEDQDSNLGMQNIEEKAQLNEDETKIREALSWKRKHFFLSCLFSALFLMIKLELSYEPFFGQNILFFLIGFTVLDIFIDQVLSRALMGEALLVSPLLSSFIVTEFIMTMGASDFQNFIVSYFVETGLVVISRTYVGPWVEVLEIKA